MGKLGRNGPAVNLSGDPGYRLGKEPGKRPVIESAVKLGKALPCPISDGLDDAIGKALDDVPDRYDFIPDAHVIRSPGYGGEGGQDEV